MCRLSQLVFPADKSLNLPPLSSSYIKCTPVNDSPDSEEVTYEPSNLPFENGPIMYLPILSAKVLAEGEDVKTVIELTLDTKEYSFDYLPGDAIGVLPQNPENEVNYVLERLLLSNSNQLFKIELNEETTKKKSLPHIPFLASAQILLRKCLDLRAVVKKTFLRYLIDYTSDDLEKRRLTELCSREGSGEYTALILSKKSCILDIMRTFPSCTPPLSLLLEHIPRLQPRPYSIASSPLGSQDSLRIVFNVVYDVNNRRGICSGWLYDVSQPFHDLSCGLKDLKLDEKHVSEKIPVYLRKPSQFRIPTDPFKPLVMIGPGTGIAPFIGFLEHRKHQLAITNSDSGQILKNWLLFGCRYPKKDELYRDDLLRYAENGLCNYLVCYSRIENDNGKKKYVQDILKEKQNEIVDQLLSSEASIFICGEGVNMTKEILQTLSVCFQNVLEISEDEAKSKVSEMEKNGRIVKDLWI